MNQHPEHPGYSLIWAFDVVLSFNGKYPRATYEVKKEYGFDDAKVATWVADWPQRWTNYKTLVKQVDRWDKHQWKVRGESTFMVNGCVPLALNMLKKNGRVTDTGVSHLTKKSSE